MARPHARSGKRFINGRWRDAAGRFTSPPKFKRDKRGRFVSSKRERKPSAPALPRDIRTTHQEQSWLLHHRAIAYTTDVQGDSLEAILEAERYLIAHIAPPAGAAMFTWSVGVFQHDSPTQDQFISDTFITLDAYPDAVLPRTANKWLRAVQASAGIVPGTATLSFLTPKASGEHLAEVAPPRSKPAKKSTRRRGVRSRNSKLGSTPKRRAPSRKRRVRKLPAHKRKRSRRSPA